MTAAALYALCGLRLPCTLDDLAAALPRLETAGYRARVLWDRERGGLGLAVEEQAVQAEQAPEVGGPAGATNC